MSEASIPEQSESKPSRCVLVTGATRGLGLAVAERLLADGYRVVGTGRNSSKAIDGLREAHPGSFIFAKLDLSHTDTLHQTVRSISAEHGPLYGLVNNAALAHDGVLATLHPNEIEEMLTVNLLGTILVTKSALRSMLLGGGGRIVSIASIVASTGFSGLSVYAATKAGLVGFSRSLAREVGRADVTVNVVSPGFLDTDMSAGLGEKERAQIVRRSPLRRLADPTSVAGAVAYFLQQESADITGTELVVDAGSTA